jgi:hypothetical protein
MAVSTYIQPPIHVPTTASSALQWFRSSNEDDDLSRFTLSCVGEKEEKKKGAPSKRVRERA